MKWKIIALAAALAVATHLSAQANIKVLHNFGSSSDGNVPAGPLLLDSHGSLYGSTVAGPGPTCCGLVFELTPSANGIWSEKILYSFTGGTNGSTPWGGLAFGASGDLYGTLEGSTAAVGAVFSLSPGLTGWTYSILYTDGIARADGPGIVLDGAGNIYGDIGPGQNDLGAVGELSYSSWAYSQLYSFCGQSSCPQGEPAPPIWDKNGNLWGVTTYGGISQSPCSDGQGCGVVFEMTPDGDGTWTYNVIHQFASSSSDGQLPEGGLVADAAGNFYGATEVGGAYNHGTIFKLSFVGTQWAETILYDFPNCVTGCFPVGTMAIGKTGNLYGTTIGGVFNQTCGGFTCGEVFEMSPQRNGRYKFTVLHKFVGIDGDVPLGVILDGKGNLFGTTKDGGAYGAGTAFELTL
jgi:uncharacterized repeat protein (TIGR03803 family)